MVLTRSAKGYAMVDLPEPGILDRQNASKVWEDSPCDTDKKPTIIL